MEPGPSKAMIYPAAILLGFGFSSMYVNSISLATELIGDNKVNLLVLKKFLHFMRSRSPVVWLSLQRGSDWGYLQNI